MLFYPTAIGWHPHEKAEHGAAQRDAWQTIQRGHAIANGVYVAAVNRVGHESPPEARPGLEFWGTSFVADPFGVVVAEASTDKEEILVAEVDLARIEEVRRNWPFLRDRRIDAYARHRAAVPRLSARGASPPVPRRLPHARRVGAARGDLARLAAQRSPTGRGKFAPIPWVYGEIVRTLAPGETCASWSTTPRHETQARRVLRARGRRPRRASSSSASPPTAAGPATTARSS